MSNANNENDANAEQASQTPKVKFAFDPQSHFYLVAKEGNDRFLVPPLRVAL